MCGVAARTTQFPLWPNERGWPPSGTGLADVGGVNNQPENLIHHLFGTRPRVLVLRGAYLGDFLLFTPALRALRHALPQARLGVIVSEPMATLATRYAAIDEIFLAPTYPEIANGRVDDEKVNAFFAQMREWQADCVLQMNDVGSSSNRFARALGGKFTAGVGRADNPDLDLILTYVPTQSVRMRHLDFLALLGIPAGSIDLELPLRPDDEVDLAEALPTELTLDQLEALPLAGLHAGAKWGARRWPADRFARVADQLIEEFGLTPVILGTETDLGAAVIAAMRHPELAINLTGRTELGALAALIKRLKIFIGNDSGPSHVAEALGIPSVIVYGVNHPFVWGPLLQAQHRIVADWTAPCRHFAPDGCPDDSTVPCLQAMSPARVLAEVRSILQDQRRIRCLRQLGCS